MYARQSILTKFLPVTNSRGSRIKAWCDAGSITIGYPHEMSGVDCHAEAVRQLCAKIDARCREQYGTPIGEWEATKWVAGALPQKFHGAHYAFVDAFPK